jgi:hypothetical protein
MTPAMAAPEPGNMTVPPMFGWGNIAILLTLAVMVAGAAFLLMAAGRADSGRSEFEAWLAGRSAGSADGRAQPQPASGPASAMSEGCPASGVTETVM